MSTRHAAGTPVVGDNARAYENYTAEQLAVLETLKDPKYSLGVAKAKYANHVLLPDGTLSDDPSLVLKAAKARHAHLVSGDLADPGLLGAAQRAASLLKEVEDHIAQKRFLFIVNEDATRIIYFQCAVPKNPDLPRLANKQDAARLAEVRQAMNALIDSSHAAAGTKRRVAAKE